MMSTSEALNFSLSSFSDTVKLLTEMTILVDNFYDIVHNATKGDDGKYSGEVHAAKEKFNEKYEKLSTDMTHDIKKLVEAMDVLISHKYDERIILSLRRFRPYIGDFKDIAEELEDDLTNLKHEIASVYRSDDFVKTSLLKKIEARYKEIEMVASTLCTKLKSFVKEDDD